MRLCQFNCHLLGNDWASAMVDTQCGKRNYRGWCCLHKIFSSAMVDEMDFECPVFRKLFAIEKDLKTNFEQTALIRLCWSNPQLLDRELWFLPELLKEAGALDHADRSAAMYYLARSQWPIHFNSHNFRLIWEAECRGGRLTLPHIIKHTPAILNRNSRFVKLLLTGARERDHKGHSAFYYAVHSHWHSNFCSKHFITLSTEAHELKEKKLKDFLSEKRLL